MGVHSGVVEFGRQHGRNRLDERVEEVLIGDEGADRRRRADRRS